MKQRERFTRETEASIDSEFAKFGITELHVRHMRAKQQQNVFVAGTPCVITVVSEHAIEYDAIAGLLQKLDSEWMCTPQIEYNYYNMMKQGYPGIAVCACGDNFNRREGRIRAKRHLISHLVRTIRSDADGECSEVEILTTQLSYANKTVANYMDLTQDAERIVAELEADIGVLQKDLQVRDSVVRIVELICAKLKDNS